MLTRISAAKTLRDRAERTAREAGAEAGRYGREIESTQDSEKLKAMEDQGLLTTYEFEDRATLLELAEPVKRAYAEELGATETLDKINSIQ